MHIHLREENYTGNAVIDDQHLDLIDLLNKAVESIKHEHSLEKIYLDLFDLQTYLDFHFRCEKMEMGIIDSLAASHHKNHCRDLLQRIDRSIRDFGRKHIQSEQLIQEMYNCLFEHINNDTQFIKLHINRVPPVAVLEYDA